MRGKLAGNSNLEQIGLRLGLQQCILCFPGTTHVSGKMMATAVEAIIGAVHLDGGDDAVDHLLQSIGLTSERLTPVTSKSSPILPLGFVT